jgi:hypothetical protein
VLDFVTPDLKVEGQPVPTLPNFLRCVTYNGAVVHVHTAFIVLIAEGVEYNTYVMADGHQLHVTEAAVEATP